MHTFHMESAEGDKKKKKKSEEIEIKPILYLEDLGLFDDEKEFYRFIIRVKYYIRHTYEYERYVKFLKKCCGLNRCGVHPNIRMEDGFQIHAHHTPLVLEDIVHIVIAKRQKRNESLTMAAIAREVMELHYLDLFGIYPLCETCHEYVHGEANDLFIPLDAVHGNTDEFFVIYREFISEAILHKYENIKTLSEGYTIIRNEIPASLMRKYIYIKAKDDEQMISTSMLTNFMKQFIDD